MAAPLSATGKWASSVGSGTPRRMERIMELHRKHFVDKKGWGHTLGHIENCAKEGRRADAKLEREHKERVQQIKEAADMRLAHALQHGSTSIRTAEEKNRIEEARQDPDEARDKMRKHMLHLHHTYKTTKQEMQERVQAKPPMNIRPKEEWDMIEEARQDPKEAKQHMEEKLKEQKDIFKAGLKAMRKRVEENPKISFRPKEQRDQIEELRQDPDEAREAMQKHMQKLARSWRDEKGAMTERVWAKPAINHRTPEEIADIEEARQDPQEAKAKMLACMRDLAAADKAHKDTIREKIRVKPPINIRPKEERERIEELRTDPDEARIKKTAQMRQLARATKEETRQMREKVHCIPPSTFRVPQERDRVHHKQLKRAGYIATAL